MSKTRIEEIKEKNGKYSNLITHVDIAYLLSEIDRLNGKVEKLEAVELVYKDKIEETNSLELELQESTVKLQALEEQAQALVEVVKHTQNLSVLPDNLQKELSMKAKQALEAYEAWKAKKGGGNV